MSFWCLKFFQKPNKKIRPTMVSLSQIVFIRFLEQLKTPKRHFEINWLVISTSKMTLACLIFSQERSFYKATQFSNRIFLNLKQGSKYEAIAPFFLQNMEDTSCQYTFILIQSPMKAAKCILIIHSMGRFIYILDSSNSSPFTFWSSQFISSSRATEPVSEPVTQMEVELINIHLISVQQKILV